MSVLPFSPHNKRGVFVSVLSSVRMGQIVLLGRLALNNRFVRLEFDLIVYCVVDNLLDVRGCDKSIRLCTSG